MRINGVNSPKQIPPLDISSAVSGNDLIPVNPAALINVQADSIQRLHFTFVNPLTANPR